MKGQRVVFEDHVTVHTRSGNRDVHGAIGTILHANSSGDDWARLVYWVPDGDAFRPAKRVGMGPDDWSSNAGQLRVLDDMPEYLVDWGQACLWCYS